MAISEDAGIGRPVMGPSKTSSGLPMRPPETSISELPYGNFVYDGMKTSGCWP